MARLIDPATKQRPTPEAVGPLARGRSVAPSGAEGKGLVAIGEGLDHAEEEIYRAVKIEQDKIDTTRAIDGYTKLQGARSEMTLGEGGFTKLRGAAAVEKPVLQEWLKKYESAETTIAGTLSNDEQRRRFKARAEVGRLQLQEDILRHVGREGEVYAKDVYDARVATEQREAISRWDNPLSLATARSGLRAAVEERGDHLAWTREYRNAVFTDEASKMHAAVIGQAIAAGRWEYAKEWYEANKGEVDPNTAKQLSRAVDDATQKQLSASYRNLYLSGHDSIPALTALEKQVSGDKVLDLERQNALIGPIRSRIETLQNRNEMHQDRVLRGIERGVNQLNARTLAGYEPSYDEFAPFIAAAKGTELEGQVQGAINLATATRAFRLTNQQQQAQSLADLESRARANPASVDHKVLSALKTIHESQGRQLRESPVTFAYEQGLANPVRIEWANLENQAEPLLARIGTARGMQQRYGTPLMPLVPTEVKEIRARLEASPTQDKITYLGNLRALSGADPTAYSAIMAQLAPDEPVLALAGEYAGKGRTDAARLLLDGQQLLRPGRRTDGTPDQGKLWPMPPETETRKRFQSLEGDAFAGNGKYRNMTEQGTRAIYARLTELAGDNSGLLKTERFQQAFNLATGGVDHYRGRALLMPYGMEIADFRRGLNARIDDIAASGRLAKGVTGEQLKNLPLEAKGDGRYIFRIGNSVVADKEGRDLVVNFNLEPSERDTKGFQGTMRGAPARQIPPWQQPPAARTTEP